MLAAWLCLAADDPNRLSREAAAKGRYEDAKAQALKAIAEGGRARNAKQQLEGWSNLSVAQAYLGAYADAEGSLQQGLKLARSAGMPEHEVIALTNVGAIYYFLGRYAEADSAYDTAAGITESHKSESWFDQRYRVIIVNRATLYQRLGQDDRALTLYRRALEGSGVLTPRDRALLATNMGVCYRRLGDPIRAMERYESAQAMYREAGDLYGELNVRKNLGILAALELGELERAARLFEENGAAARKAGNRREELQALLYSGEAQYRLRKLEAAHGSFVGALELARQLGTKEEEWKALYGLGRVAARGGNPEEAAGHLRAAVGAIESLRSGLSLAPLRSDFLADKAAVFDALIDLRKDAASPGELFALMEASRARNFQDRIQVERPSVDRVRQALAPDTVLLSYWFYREKGLVIEIRSAGVRTRSLTLDPEQIPTLRSRVLERKGDGWKNAARQLGQSLLEGVDLAGVRHLIIVPDAELETVPFEVLESGGTMLIEKTAVSYLPSSGLLLRPAAAAGRRWPWQTEISAFGDPVVPPDANWMGGPVLPPIPGSAVEARMAAALLPGRAGVYVGAENRKVRFLEAGVRQVPVLHLATHAVADLSNPERSQLVFSAALSKDPDPLYLRQLADLDLRGVDLAVLSACETELGRSVGGEGSQTMGRAFLAGGSRSVVTTLWRVEDRSAVQLMHAFYAALASGGSKAEALRRAKLAMIARGGTYAHPGYWAAFLLMGEGHGPIPLPVPAWAFIGGSTAAALAAGAMLGRKTQPSGTGSK